jgi:WD40 repeat protein
VRYSPDGGAVAAGDDDGYIRVWDAATGKERWAARPYRKVDCLAYAPGGKVLASAGPSAEGSAVILWDAATGRELCCAARSKERVHAVAFSPDGRVLAVAVPNEHATRVLDAASAEERLRVASFCTDPDGLSFSPDGSLLAAEALSGGVCLWSAKTSREVLRLRDTAGDGGPVCFSPDGANLAVRGTGGVRTFAAADGKVRCKFKINSGGPIAYTPDGEMLLAGQVGAVGLWDASTGREVRRVGRCPGSVISMSPSPDGKTVAVGTTDGALRLMDVATGAEVLPHQEGSYVIRSAALAPDGQAVATALAVGKVAVWGVRGAKPRWVMDEGQDEYTRGVTFSPDGRTVAVAFSGGARIRDAETGRLVRGWGALGGGVSSVAFSPDGRSLACDHMREAVAVYDVATGRARFRVSIPDRRVCRIQYNPDGGFLATATDDGWLRLWDTADGGAWRSLPGRTGGLLVLACSPDGQMLASRGRGGSVRVRELATGGERVRLNAKSSGCTALAFAPGGRVLAAGDAEGMIRLYDLDDGKERFSLRGHRGAVDSLEFSDDCRTLLSVSEDTSALIWAMGEMCSVVGGRPAGRLNAREFDALWEDLAQEDAARAYRAVLALAASPGAASLIRGRLPAGGQEQLRRRGQIERLTAALDSDRFAEREGAEADLRKVGDDAVPWLRRAAGGGSAEGRRRAGRVLQAMREGPPAPESVRALRAVEVLARMATAEAEVALRSLAEGVPEFRLTQAAQAALRQTSRPREGAR